MKLSVSNIAWKPSDRFDAYKLLQEFGISGLEIAPSLFFPNVCNPFNPPDELAQRSLDEINSFGLSLTSMQSLLYGVEGAALFGNVKSKTQFESAMRRAIDLAGRLGIPNLVFGSPRNRIVPNTLTMEHAFNEAAAVFQRLGDKAHASNTILTIESNPVAYGTNFINTFNEAISFVSIVNHPAIKVNLDIGAIHMNGEFGSIAKWISSKCKKIAHVHISEPNLSPAPANDDQAKIILDALNSAGYENAVSIEMKASTNGLDELRTSLERLTSAARKIKMT